MYATSPNLSKACGLSEKDAEHLIWMEGGSYPEETSGKPASLWPGLAVTIGIAGFFFGLQQYGLQQGWESTRLLDPVFLSMLASIAVGNFCLRESWKPGAVFAVRVLLIWGIVLLGARMNLTAALSIGLPGLVLSILVVTLALLLLWAFARAFQLNEKLACLLGVGTGICGGTAIVAIAPLLSAKDRDVVLSVTLVTMIGLLAMVALPVLAMLLGLTQFQFGLLAGLTIHQTPQVIASGFAFGDEAGQVATVSKLARVCLLAPVAVGIGWWMARQSSSTHLKRPWYSLLPGFALGFLVLAAISSLGGLPEVMLTWDQGTQASSPSFTFDTAAAFKFASTFLLAVGMAGVGCQTKLSHFQGIGWAPILSATLASLIIGAVVLTLVLLFF